MRRQGQQFLQPAVLRFQAARALLPHRCGLLYLARTPLQRRGTFALTFSDQTQGVERMADEVWRAILLPVIVADLH
jgi:hypothetical protein